MKKTVSYVLLCLSLFSVPASYAGVMLQGFYWDAETSPQNSWWNTLGNKTHDLSKAGFTALWIPPVLKSASGGYSRGYDPFDDYDLGSKDQRDTLPTRWGSRKELQLMVAKARANGLDVILDVNVTHRAGDPGDKSFLYKDAKGVVGKGRFQKGPMDFVDWNFPYGRFLNYNSQYVVDNLAQAGEWLIKSLGTQGVRIDSAKYVPASFLKTYLNHGEIRKQYSVVEHWSGADELYNFLKPAMNSRTAAFDFGTWSLLKEMAEGNGFFDMRRLQRPGLMGLAPELAVTFAENDDTDRGFPTMASKDLSYAFILTSEGYPCVYWKDYFVYGMKNTIDNLMWINGALAQGGTTSRWADEDLMVYERSGQGAGLLVGLNDNTWQTRRETVATNFGPNVQLKDYSGKQGDVWTDHEGKVTITVGPRSYVAYSRVGVEFSFRPHHYRTTQEFFGAPDLDIPAATQEGFREVGQIYVEANTALDWEITYERHGWSKDTVFEMQILSPSGKVIARNAYGASVGIARGSVTAPQEGWYRLEAQGQQAPGPINFWWKATYQPPR